MNNENNPKKEFTSFADLDLGLDFDLSFLDDIDESVLDEPAPTRKSAAAKEVPAEEAPLKKAAPAKRPAQASAPAKKAPAAKPAAKAPAKEPAGKSPAPKAAAKEPAKTKQAPAKKQPAAPEAPAKKQKRGPRIGGVIFYTLYFMFILAFFIATYIGLTWLHGWLTDYELSQPTVKAEQVFNEVFTNPNWGDLYESAGAPDSAYEGKEEYVSYMENKVGDTKLTYVETSVGLDKYKKKYLVRLGDEKVASFTLVDQNQTDNISLENLENATDIPDWQLGAVEVFFEREGTYYIEKLNGHIAYVNGVALDDSFTIQVATTLAESYLPEGTTGVSMCTQEVTGLMEQPEVTVTDKEGNVMEVTYDETTRTFTERTESNTMSEDEKAIALEAAHTNCLWMIEELKDRGTVAKYFDPSYEPYNSIVKTTELWMQDFSSYEFVDEQVTNYARYSDDIFSVRVSLTLKVTRPNGTYKDYPFAKSMFFHKSESGKWLVFEMTNVDVSEPVGKVRLTFMDGDIKLDSNLIPTDSKEVVTPLLPTREGKVFTGWVTITENEEGSTVYNLEFQPDPSTGKVSIPEGTTLKPMTLHALFQNPEDAAATAGAAAEETTPAETTPAETAAAETAAPETT